MKASELRIGNFLELNSLTDGSKTWVEVGLFHLNEIGKTIKYKYDPIPLTEEWLLKFGFENSSSFGVEYYEIGRLTICQSDCLVYIEDLYGIEVKHVHQLQNLYFALTGEELEIKEND